MQGGSAGESDGTRPRSVSPFLGWTRPRVAMAQHLSFPMTPRFLFRPWQRETGLLSPYFSHPLVTMNTSLGLAEPACTSILMIKTSALAANTLGAFASVGSSMVTSILLFTLLCKVGSGEWARWYYYLSLRKNKLNEI